VSYAELLDGITRAANVFVSIGGPAPGVAYMLPILVETHFTLWGAETAGYAVPINFLLQPPHIAELIRASGAKILVALGPHPQFDIWQKAVAVRDLVPGLTLIRVSAGDTAQPHGEDEFVAALKAQPGTLSFAAVRRDDDIAAYFHTGGTTGAPKLVAHTHTNQIVAGFGGAILQDIDETDKLTSGLPMFHLAATISCGLSYFIAGASLVLLSPAGMRNPLVVKNYWRIVARTGATVIGGVPTTLAALLDVPVDADLSSVRRSVSGGAMLPRAVAEKFEAMTGTKVHEILGMTETGGLIAIDPFAGERVPGSAGYRLPYTQVEVRRLSNDDSQGEVCAPHEVGLLMVGGPHVTLGYRDPDQNAELQKAGYFNSGDLAYSDESGRLFIAGRAKDLIIRSGHNIDPLVIEGAMQAHPAVALAAAVGQPDRYAGELPICYVALRPGTAVTPAELIQFAEPLIPERPAWPKEVFIVDVMPLTGVGKIFKPQLRADATRRVVLAQIAAATASIENIDVDVVAGGKRGIKVTVMLPPEKAHARATIEGALDGYLFECIVKITTNDPDIARS
jgi:fatty-acyl-CoA synthase